MFGSLHLTRSTSPTAYEAYREYYCGLCSALGRQYGNAMRLTLSYDSTFLYALADDLSQREHVREQVSCPLRPWSPPIGRVNDDVSSLIAAVHVYLVDMKIRDEIADSGKVRYRLVQRAIRPKKLQAIRYLQLQGVDVVKAEEFFSSQQQAERKGTNILDFSNPTEEGLALLFGEVGRLTEAGPKQTRALADAGRALGRIIYILDSYVDYPADVRCNRFNALAEAFGDRVVLDSRLCEEVRDMLALLLQEAMGDAREKLNQLRLERAASIATGVMDTLERRIQRLLADTRSLQEMERSARGNSFVQLLKRPRLLLRGQSAAHYHYRSSGCCCPLPSICQLAICCDAADCDCDMLEGCVQGDCCECLECCG